MPNSEARATSDRGWDDRVIQLRRFDVTQVSIWAARLDEVRECRSELEADIDSALETDRNGDAMGEQTLAVLQSLRGRHWDLYRSGLRASVQSLLQLHAPQLLDADLQLTTWAMKLGRPGTYPIEQLRLAGVHNHFPAFLSSIYYVRVPQSLKDRGTAGTAFINFFPHSLVRDRPGTSVDASEGVLVLFPSWVLHTPLAFEYQDDVEARVVIASDIYVVPRDSITLGERPIRS